MVQNDNVPLVLAMLILLLKLSDDHSTLEFSDEHILFKSSFGWICEGMIVVSILNLHQAEKM